MAKKYKGRMDRSGGYEVDGLKGKNIMGHASKVYEINTNSEQYDMGRVKPYKQGTRGYPSQAFDYKY